MSGFVPIHFLACLFASKQVQTVDDVQHGITVNAVVFRITTTNGINGACKVALIVQHIIELEG